MLLIIIIAIVTISSFICSQLKHNKTGFFEWLISGILSLSLLCVLFDVWLFLGFSYISYIIFIALLSITSVGLLFKSRIRALSLKVNINRESIIFISIILIATILFTANSAKWGEWDAWAIWSLHAKFLFYDNSMANLFSEPINWSHPDYPLMLPSLIALLWKSVGSVNSSVPIIVAYLTFVAILCFMYTSINDSRLKIFSLLGVFFLALDVNFIAKAAYQYADSLLSLFILITTILVSKKKDAPDYMFLITGVFASLNIWIKNEGVIFFTFISLLMLFQHYRNKKQLMYYALGVLPMLVVFIYFKIVYAPVNDLVGAQGGSSIEKILTFDRYIVVAKYFKDILLSQYFLAVLLSAIVFTLQPKKLISGVVLVLAATLVSYLFVYIITYHDLSWHLSTSLSRLLSQLYPAYLYYCLFILYEYVKKILPRTSST